MLETTNHNKAPKEEVESLLTLYYQGKFQLILEKEKQFSISRFHRSYKPIWFNEYCSPTLSKSHF